MTETRTRQAAILIGGVLLVAAAYGLYRGMLSGVATWHTTLAREDLARGEQAEALAHLQSAIAWDPDHLDAQLLLARAERVDPARDRLRELVDRGAVSVEVLDCLARIHEESGDAEIARGLFRELTRRYPNDLSGPLGLARLGDRTELEARLPERTFDGPVRGVSLLHLDDGFGALGYGTPAAVESLRRARAIGANTVSLRAPGRQPDVHTPNIVFGHEPPGGETDAVLRRAIRDAKELGFRVLMKPHVMLSTITESDWRGTITFDTAEARAAWWSDYRRYILHFATMAAEYDVEYFAVGVELRSLVNDCPDEWRELIADVRNVYDGHLTYAANWYYEFAEVPFWDALDSIGIQFFFPATDADEPTVEQAVKGLEDGIRDIAELAFLLQKPVLLTEVGYKSTPGGLAEPWVWPSEDARPDEDVQAVGYRAILEVFAKQEWCAGLIWWNWLTLPEPDRKFAHDFTPQGKAAEEVVREAWGEMR